jgi:hypothetical protein
MDEVGPEYGISVGRSQLVFAGYPLTQMNIFVSPFGRLLLHVVTGVVEPVSASKRLFTGCDF